MKKTTKPKETKPKELPVRMQRDSLVDLIEIMTPWPRKYQQRLINAAQEFYGLLDEDYAGAVRRK